MRTGKWPRFSHGGSELGMHLKVMLILFYIYVNCREDLLCFLGGGAGG